jgi:hypothetical protein
MRPTLFILLALVAGDAWTAQRIVIYRCTDAKGGVILQNDTPCAKGSKQEKRVVEAPVAAPVAPAPAAPAPAAAPASAGTTTPGTATSPPLAAPSPEAAVATPQAPPNIAAAPPPPALYRCVNARRETYFSDTDLQPRRCVPMRAVGLDGNPQTGAGAVCEMMRDPCQAIAEPQLCAGWRQRAEEAATTVRFGVGEQAANAKTVLERSRSVLRESCPSE